MIAEIEYNKKIHLSFDDIDSMVVDESVNNANTAEILNDLKVKAQEAFNASQYLVAECLYSRSIDILPTASLFCNRSVVMYCMGRFENALADAERAISLDSSNPDGYLCKGRACMMLSYDDAASDAITAFKEGLCLDPGNSDYQIQVDEAKALTFRVANTEPDSLALNSTTETNNGTKDDTEPGGLNVTKSPDVMVYKHTCDGRLALVYRDILIEDEPIFFRNPMLGYSASESVKINENDDKLHLHTDFSSKMDVTEWCKDHLTKLLTGTTVLTPPGPIKVTKVANISGKALASSSNEKQQNIFQFNLEVEWEANWNCGLVRGTIILIHLTSSNKRKYQVSFRVDDNAPKNSRPYTDLFIKGDKAGFRVAIDGKLDDFVKDFTEKKFN